MRVCDGREWVDARGVLEAMRGCRVFRGGPRFQAAIPLHDLKRKEPPQNNISATTCTFLEGSAFDA